MRTIYTVLIFTYTFFIKIASLFSNKASLWVRGRKDIFKTISDSLQNEKNKIIWVHASSLGEFEQGRPVIERIKVKYPNFKIVLTFFSPSGYEVKKDYKNADYIFYLPADTPYNSKAFVSLVKPQLAIFIKYEYWFNYLDILYKKSIPVFFISAIFRPEHYFFRFYGRWALKRLQLVSHFFVQNKLSETLLNANGITQVTVSGDTRFDRVIKITTEPKAFPQMEEFGKNSKILIAGSTWPKDDALLLDFFKNRNHEIKLVIAPHEINNEYINKLMYDTKSRCCKFSELSESNASEFDVVIVDGIGFLSHLYRYASIAYIGGGFGKGIHNILEAACFGLPVIFGPHYKKFAEALSLAEEGGAFPISNNNDLYVILTKLLNDVKYHQLVSDISKNFVLRNSGATDIIDEKIKMLLNQNQAFI
ncbi:MAG: glycosyltransferase N-terminal domain-containing protein [Bacteroidales bacterium]|nr:glycosyltransferase N-terminal domain-containing protein [Bacteroidales bacterium]